MDGPVVFASDTEVISQK